MTNTTIELSKPQIKKIVWTMLSLMVIIGMCIDLVAPSLPAIAKSLQVTNDVSKNTVSIYLLGYALGNFFTGFLTDAWGRKKLMRLSLLGFLVASLIPVIFPHIGWLLFARFLQGYTLGAVSVLLRAVCADVLTQEELVQLGPWFGTLWGLGPIFGPIIGGYFQVYFGWQAGFYFFAVMALIAFLLVFFILPETQKESHPLHFLKIKSNLREIFSHRLFIGIAVLMGFSYGVLIIFNVSGPFLIQNHFGFSPVYFGRVAFWLGVVFLLGTILIRQLVKKISVEKLWLVNINAAFLITLVFLIFSLYYGQSMLLVILSSAFIFFASGMIFPVSFGKGLSLFRHAAGTATAVMYLINILISSLLSYLTGFIEMNGDSHLVLMYFVPLLFIMITYWCVLRVFK